MIAGSEHESRMLMIGAAVRIVSREGFEGFTTKKWAAEAGVAEGSLYYHFKSKNDLLEQAYLMIDRDLSGLYEIEDRTPEEAEAYIEEIWDKCFHYFIDNPDNGMYYFRFRSSPRYTAMIRKRQKEYYKVFLGFLEQTSLVKFTENEDVAYYLWLYISDFTTDLASRVITGAIKWNDSTREIFLCTLMRGLMGVTDSVMRQA